MTRADLETDGKERGAMRRAETGYMALLLAAALLWLPASAQAAEQAIETLPEKPVIKQFGNWNTRCEQYAGKPDSKRCHAFVDVRVGDRKERILYLGLGYMPDEKPGTVFIFAVTPLGTMLPNGFRMRIDEKTSIDGHYLFCAPTGCQAEVTLTPAQLAALREGNELEVVFHLVEQGEVKVPMKLDGFKKAFDSLPKSAPARPGVKGGS